MITKEECNQMAKMYQWAEESGPFQFISLRLFKQYSKKTKTTNIVYEVTSLEWVGEKWRHTIGNGSTLTLSMQEFTHNYNTRSKESGLLSGLGDTVE